MIRAVFDANTLVSAIPAASGTLVALVDCWRAAQFRLIVSEPILDEVVRAWTKPYWRTRFPPPRIARALVLLRRDADVIQLTVLVSGAATHPEDDLVLATAVSGQADYLVTGDRQLQRLDTYRGVTILFSRHGNFWHCLRTRPLRANARDLHPSVWHGKTANSLRSPASRSGYPLTPERRTPSTM